MNDLCRHLGDIPPQKTILKEFRDKTRTHENKNDIKFAKSNTGINVFKILSESIFNLLFYIQLLFKHDNKIKSLSNMQTLKKKYFPNTLLKKPPQNAPY